MRAKADLVGSVFWLVGWLWRELRHARKPSRSFTVRESSSGRVLTVKPTIEDAKDVAAWNMARCPLEIVDREGAIVATLTHV